MKKALKVSKKKINHVLEDLSKIPYAYVSYKCARCKFIFSFVSGMRCACEKTHKFRAKPVFVNDIYFDGLREGQRYSKLSFLEQKNIIQELEVHPSFEFCYDGKSICKYEADFRYKLDGQIIIEDVKGKRTALFRLKYKMFKAFYPNENLYLIKV